MVGVFRQKSSSNVAMLFVLGVLLKIPTLFNASPAITNPRDGILYQKLTSILDPIATGLPFIYNWLSFFIILPEAIMLANFVGGQRLTAKANFMPGMAFILVTSFLPEFNRFSAPLLTSILLLSACIQLFKAHAHKFAKNHIFSAGILLGLCPMFFFPSVIFVIFGLIAISLLRPFRLNEWILLFLGALTPYYFLAAYLYLANGTWFGLMPKLKAGIPAGAHSLWLAGCLFLALVPLFAGVYYVQRQQGRMLIHVRRGWSLFGFYILFGVLALFFNPGSELENFLILLPPVAAFHGYAYLNAEWRPFALICFWATAFFIAAFQIFAG